MRTKIILAVLVFSIALFSQSVRTKRLIDIPTCFDLKKAEIEIGGRLYSADGMSGEINIGLFRNFFFGVSYGGTRIIGREDPVWNGHPGVRLQYLMLKEDFYYPNLSIGFDSQGHGGWTDPRYVIKSKGFYLVLSKNYFVSGGQLGTLGLHAGVNYCVTEEPVSGDDNMNAFFGFDKSLFKNMNLLAEYDFAFNDDSKKAPTNGRGYLNLGLRWSFNGELHMEFDLKDLLRNLKGVDGSGRELRVIYNTSFFVKN